MPDPTFKHYKLDVGDGLMHLAWYRGGTWSAYDTTVELDTGALRSLSYRQDIARWSLPSGWHSGPYKRTFSKFECANLLGPQQPEAVGST